MTQAEQIMEAIYETTNFYSLIQYAVESGRATTLDEFEDFLDKYDVFELIEENDYLIVFADGDIIMDFDDICELHAIFDEADMKEETELEDILATIIAEDFLDNPAQLQQLRRVINKAATMID